MNINDKIEEIRKKPEHVRLRYVWGGVAIIMLFILIIWIFSLPETFKSSEEEKKISPPAIGEEWNQAKEELPSIKEFLEESSENIKELEQNEIQPPADEESALDESANNQPAE